MRGNDEQKQDPTQIEWLATFASQERATGVWKLPSGATVPYSNDRFAEHSLRTILLDSSDLSSLSPELAGHGKNWPASYYLSPQRTNLLRGFDWDSSARVLEVGAGCGSITRFLGETFGHVVGVEGNSVRAETARIRTRDLDNVEIVNAPIQEVPAAQVFDIVFCVGVLEYASSFVHEDDPYAFMLGHMRDYLSQGGLLVLAIENKMGLKYFAGCAEDHSGIKYDGIEGYARSAHGIAHTFSKKELGFQLAQAGFKSSEFFYPFPDYKLVSAMGSEEALSRGGGSVVSLLLRQQAFDYLSPPSKTMFDQQATMRELIKAGLADEMANSFLVMASRTERDPGLYSREWDAVAFSIGGRLPQFWAKTEVFGIGRKDATSAKSQLRVDGPRSSMADQLFSNLPTTDRWLDELSLGTTITEASKDPRFGVRDLAERLQPWQEYLAKHTRRGGVLNGSFLDAIPQNMVFSGGQWHFIDREFEWGTTVSAKSVWIRGVLEVLSDAEATPGAVDNLRGRSLARVLSEVSRHAGCTIKLLDLYEASRLEAALQEKTRGVKQHPFLFVLFVLRHRIGGGSPLYRSKTRIRRTAGDFLRKLGLR